MAGITDIGNGIGYVYKTDPTGTDILGYEPNTKQGVRSMQQQGVTNAPIVGNRSSVGTITFTACNGVGNVTGVVINGISQIGANVPCTTTNVDDLAQDVANAINSWTAAGNPYTALAFGGGTGLVYVYSSPEFGTSTNGLTITVSVDDPSITFTTTPFADGSSEVGVNDSVLGYKFYIDSSLAAVPDSIVGAVDITVYMTQRGMQVGMAPVDEIINNDTLFNINRTSTFTIVNVDTEGAALTDTLAQIDPQNFIEGDIIFLRQENPARVITVQSTTGPSTALTPNIELTSGAAFVTSMTNTLMLQLRYSSTNTLIWTEITRSVPVASSLITTTLSALNADVVSGSLSPNSLYFVSDLGNAGTFVNSTSATQININGQMLRYVPDNYFRAWQTPMTAPVVGSRYRYYQGVYRSLTGSVGSQPDIDLVNWQLELTSTSYYRLDLHSVELNFTTGVGIVTAWPIVCEKDSYNNEIRQSKDYFTLVGQNAFELFSWQSTVTPVINVSGNSVNDSIFDCGNHNAQTTKNTLENGSLWSGNRLAIGGLADSNYLSASSVSQNYCISITSNSCIGGSGIINNGSPNQNIFLIASNSLSSGGLIQGNTTLDPSGGYIQENVLEKGAIKFNQIDFNCGIRYCNVINEGSRIESTILTSSSFLDSCSVSAGGILNILHVNGGVISNQVVIGGQVNITAQGPWSGGLYVNSNITWTNAAQVINTNTFINCSSLTLDGIVQNSCLINVSDYGIGAVHSNVDGVTVAGATASDWSNALDLDDPAIFNSGVLTIPVKDFYSGIFVLGCSSPKTITAIVNLPPYDGVNFLNNSPFTITFSTTARSATLNNDQILGDLATYTIDSVLSVGLGSVRLSDIITITRQGIGLPTVVNHKLLL